MSKNIIEEPNTPKGGFESKLRILSNGIKNFECPICHSHAGIRFKDEDVYLMHFDTTQDGNITTAKGHGTVMVSGSCMNCGYIMNFDITTIPLEGFVVEETAVTEEVKAEVSEEKPKRRKSQHTTHGK